MARRRRRKLSAFGRAFADARAKALKGGPQTFTFGGKTYTTRLKGESGGGRTKVRKTTTGPGGTTTTTANVPTPKARPEQDVGATAQALANRREKPLTIRREGYATKNLNYPLPDEPTAAQKKPAPTQDKAKAAAEPASPMQPSSSRPKPKPEEIEARDAQRSGRDYKPAPPPEKMPEPVKVSGGGVKREGGVTATDIAEGMKKASSPEAHKAAGERMRAQVRLAFPKAKSSGVKVLKPLQPKREEVLEAKGGRETVKPLPPAPEIKAEPSRAERVIGIDVSPDRVAERRAAEQRRLPAKVTNFVSSRNRYAGADDEDRRKGLRF